jgi:hypothetical protein
MYTYDVYIYTFVSERDPNTFTYIYLYICIYIYIYIYIYTYLHTRIYMQIPLVHGCRDGSSQVLPRTSFDEMVDQVGARGRRPF